MHNKNTLIKILTIIILSTGCSANWHIKRAIKKDPSVLTAKEIKFDTVVITEQKYLTDTVVMNEIDSVTVVKDNVVTKLWRVHDTIRVETICPPDTIRIEVIKEVAQVVYDEKQWWEKKWFRISLVLLLIGIVAYKGITYVKKEYFTL